MAGPRRSPFIVHRRGCALAFGFACSLAVSTAAGAQAMPGEGAPATQSLRSGSVRPGDVCPEERYLETVLGDAPAGPIARVCVRDGQLWVEPEALHAAATEQRLSAGGLLKWLAQQRGEDGLAPDEYQLRLERDEASVKLVTVHKSKGLEFHTMLFYGLDNETWWSLTPDKTEELNSFFVAFTRAKKRAIFTLCTERGHRIGWLEKILIPGGVRRARF
jgi:hypothetical protein